MSESMRSHELPFGEASDEEAARDSVESSNEAEIVTGQFLNQCRHSSVAPKEELAAFILAALHDESSDEFIQELQRQPVDTTDEQFDTLIRTDDIFRGLYDMAVRLRSIVGRGESMSSERKALIALMDLRAGEAIHSNGNPTENEAAWQAVLAKLFPDLI